METGPEDLLTVFKPFIGKKVELAFTPFKTQSNGNIKHKLTNTLKQKRMIKPEQCKTYEAVKDYADIGTTNDKSADDIVREYIDFVNQQVGVYMDAIAGFAGHHARVERQVCRVMRKTKSKK